MKHNALMALLGIFLLVTSVGAQSLQMPACMSTCVAPFSANHEPDLCTSSWTSKISSCINDACSTTVSSDPNNVSNAIVNASMTFVPKVLYACTQSYVPGSSNDPPSPALIVSDGECTQSPYDFMSFLPMYTDRVALDTCTLQIFTQDQCAGKVSNMTMNDDAKSGECSFKSGRSVKLVCKKAADGTDDESDNAAAHNYLSWLCDGTATASPTAVTMSTVTTPASQVGSFNTSCSSGNSTLGAGNPACILSSGNMTAATRTSTMVTPTVGLASTETGWSKADRAFEHHSAAMALVIVVFARSMML